MLHLLLLVRETPASVTDRRSVDNLRAGLVFAAALALPAQALAGSCPADRPRLLREQPDALIPCRDAPEPVLRVWDAHRLRVAGKSREATLAYVALEGVLPQLSDELRLAAAEAGLEGGEAPARVLELLPERMPASKWQKARWLALKARALAAEGNFEEVRRATARAQEHGASGALMASVTLKAALKAGRRDEARAALRTLRVDHPDTVSALEAERLFGDGHPLTDLSGADRARRWSRWITRGGAGSVAAECVPGLPALAAEEKRPNDARLRFECGRALATLRRPDARRFLEEASRGERAVRPKALLALARVVGRDNDASKVEAVCAQLAEMEARSESAECDLLAAVIRLQQGDRAGGRAGLDRVAKVHRRHERSGDAHWFLALDDWRDAPLAALSRLNRLVGGAKEATEKAQYLYWRGLARTSTDPEGARSDWRQSARLDPYGYYGWLSSERAGLLPESAADEVTEGGVAKLPGGAAEIRALLDAGFFEEARAELHEKVSPRKADATAWVPLLTEAGQFERILSIGQSQHALGQPWPPPPSKRVALQAAFPLAFGDAMNQLPGDVERFLVLALMRRESRYDPRAASPAQARGLLQILPVTATLLASELGLPKPSDEELFDPATNIRLGSSYIHRLQARFGQQPLLVAAAYNAGPKAVASWLNERSGMPIDEWVERIPYRETRAYVKAVAAAYAAYALIYMGQRPRFSFAPVVPCGDGIDF